jgi:hypothetical protein
MASPGPGVFNLASGPSLNVGAPMTRPDLESLYVNAREISVPTRFD